jgi:hypothetical protein
MSKVILLRLLVALLVGACDEDAPDGNGLVLELADQPSTPEFGVLVSIHARGGESIGISIQSGTIITASDPEGTPATSECTVNVGHLDAFTSELAVMPDGDASLLSATLYSTADCSKSGLQSRLFVIEKPLVAAVLDAGEDAP